MSTTYESAKKWIQDKNPAVDEIQAVVAKLEKRIEDFNGEDENIQGSIEAVGFLQAHLASVNIASTEDIAAELDPSPLIPDDTPIELEKDVKEHTFSVLKAQLGIKL